MDRRLKGVLDVAILCYFLLDCWSVFPGAGSDKGTMWAALESHPWGLDNTGWNWPDYSQG